MKQVNIRPYNKEMDENKVMEIILNEEGWDYANEEIRENMLWHWRNRSRL